MRLVAIEANGPRCSVAVADDAGPLGDWTGDLGNAVAGPLLEAVQSLLSSSGLGLSDINVFAACVGPGSFTGVKIAVTLAKTLAHANRVETVGVGTLEAMASDVRTTERLACVLPAKVGHYYVQFFEGGAAISEACMVPEDETREMLSSNTPCLVASPREWDDLPEGSSQVGFTYPSAVSVARIAVPRALQGNTLSPMALVPNYVASYSITQPKKPLSHSRPQDSR